MLQISEIYKAICGESRHNGRPCTLVRLTGCHLRCVWCDTAHAFGGGESLGVADVVARVRANGLATVLVTGGEPLLQRETLALLADLLADGRRVLLETSGTLLGPRAATLAEVPRGVCRIVDVKAPGSGIAAGRIDWAGIAELDGGDELKIVCADRRDYAWARDLIRGGERLPAGVPISLSAVHGRLEPRDLAAWLLDDALDVFFQVQLHKVVWPEVERGV